MTKKSGLYANIQAKRESGKKMRSPGEEGAPSAQDFKDAAKTAKKPKKDECRCGKADKQRKSPYADGCGYNKDAMAEEFNSILINERADKKCGKSGIPDNAKCTKSTASAPLSKKKKSGGFSLNKTLQNVAGIGIAAGIVAGANAIETASKDRGRRRGKLTDLKYAKGEANRKYNLAKESYNRSVAFNNSQFSDPDTLRGANNHAFQKLNEARLQRKMRRTEIKQYLRGYKRTWPKSKARKRAAAK